MSGGWGSISDSCHKAFLELAKVLINWNPKEEPVQSNESLELLKQRMEEKRQLEELKKATLAKVVKFVEEVGDVVIDCGGELKKFKECVLIHPDKIEIWESTFGIGSVTVIESVYYSETEKCKIRIVGAFSDPTEDEKESIEFIVQWLLSRGAKLPKLKDA